MHGANASIAIVNPQKTVTFLGARDFWILSPGEVRVGGIHIQ